MPVVNSFAPFLFALVAFAAGLLSRRTHPHVVVAAVATVLAAVLLIVLSVRHVTPFIGLALLIVPFFAAAYGLLVGATSWALATLFGRSSDRRHTIAAIAVLACVLFVAGSYGRSEWIARNVERGSYGADRLRELARGDDMVVLRAVARQRATPPDVLLQLAKRTEPELRQPPAGVGSLLRDADTAVLAEVAANPATPPEALQLLAREPVWRISEPAARAYEARLAAPAVARERAQTAVVTAADPQTRPETLAALAGSDDVAVRAAVGRNGSTPPATLLRLATDPDASVRAAAAPVKTPSRRP